MKFEIVIHPEIFESSNIPKDQQQKLLKKIDLLLKENPFPFQNPKNIKKMSALKNGYRLRVDIYRVIYTVSKGTVTILKIGIRSKVYKKI